MGGGEAVSGVNKSLTEDQVRMWVEHCVTEQWGERLYRGYVLCGVGWRQGDYGFRLQAYMRNSPLYPNDIMYVDCDKVQDWREYRGATGSTLARNAVASLKRLIDLAYDKPNSFVPSRMAVRLESEK